MDGHRKWFLDVESTSGEDTTNIFEMTIKDLEYYVNVFDRVGAGFERIAGILKVL